MEATVSFRGLNPHFRSDLHHAGFFFLFVGFFFFFLKTLVNLLNLLNLSIPFPGLFSPQKEEGKVQGQLNNTDSSQYIRDLKDQITELKHEVRSPL